MDSSSVGKRSEKGKPDSLEIKFSVNRVFPYKEVRASIGGKEVGLFSYRVDKGYLRANGTEVLPSYQNRGIGLAMWDAVLNKHNLKGVVVCTVSEAGEKFITKLSRLYPDLEWDRW